MGLPKTYDKPWYRGATFDPLARGTPEPKNSVRLEPKPEGPPKWLMAQILKEKDLHEAKDHVPSLDCRFCLAEYRRWKKAQLAEASLRAAHSMAEQRRLETAEDFLREHGVALDRRGNLK
jgi:hypothetical protein